MTAPTRRVLVGSAAGRALVAGAPMPAMAASPDTELLRLCAAAVESHRINDAAVDAAFSMPAGQPDTEAAWGAISARTDDWHALGARISAMPAGTPDGISAKAEVLACVEALESPLVASLVSDLLGRPIPPPEAVPASGEARVA